MGRGMTPVGIVEALLEGLGGVGALTYKRPEFLCHCSDQRVYQALRLLQKEEVCVFGFGFWWCRRRFYLTTCSDGFLACCCDAANLNAAAANPDSRIHDADPNADDADLGVDAAAAAAASPGSRAVMLILMLMVLILMWMLLLLLVLILVLVMLILMLMVLILMWILLLLLILILVSVMLILMLMMLILVSMLLKYDTRRGITTNGTCVDKIQNSIPLKSYTSITSPPLCVS